MRTSSLAVALLIGLSVPALAESFSGTAAVVDGDTIYLRTQGGGGKIRLQGIDAPESDQSCGSANGGTWPCGRVARDRLASVIAGNVVTCEVTEQDRYGRGIGTCFLGGRDLNQMMVRLGLAVAYVKFSQAYAGEEAAAKAERRGIWQGEFTPPWIWRQQHPKSF